jgi:hypothetical protein
MVGIHGRAWPIDNGSTILNVSLEPCTTLADFFVLEAGIISGAKQKIIKYALHCVTHRS